MRREWSERHVEERVMVDSRSVNVSIVDQHVSIAVVAVVDNNMITACCVSGGFVLFLHT